MGTNATFKRQRELRDEQSTIDFGAELFEAMSASFQGWTVLLSGELGAGKSTFARAFIRAAGHVGAIPSPTYTLVEPYQLASESLYHIDLYRIASEEELEYLGFDELADGLRLIEWPERAPRLASEADLQVHFDYAGEGRTATISALSERASDLIQKIN